MWRGEAHRFGELWRHCTLQWKGKSCSAMVTDKFLHYTDPGLEQERINVTFRWIKQHVPSCSRDMLFANVCAGFISFCYGVCREWRFFGVEGRFGLLLGALCIWGVLALPVYPFVCTGLGSHWCASCWTRPLGGGRWRHYLCNLWEENAGQLVKLPNIFMRLEVVSLVGSRVCKP